MKVKSIILIMLAMSVLMVTSVIAKIEPGLVITKDNYQKHLSDLKELLPDGSFRVMVKELETGNITVPIVETRQYFKPKAFLEATKKYSKDCRVDSNSQLIGWKAGAPFSNPKNALELAWNFDKRHMTGDQYSFYSSFQLFDKGKKERFFRWHYWKMIYCGRFEAAPMPELEGNNQVAHLKEAFIVLDPFDVKGFCMMRSRFMDIDRMDEVYSYIPAIRRIRRLTGADVCDPILGSDLPYDDFDYTRQKISSRMTFKMSERDMLVCCHKIEEVTASDPVKETMRGNFYQTEWEIRPVWVLEIEENDPDYMYSKRIMYMEKLRGTFVGHAQECFDQKGRLYRMHFPVINSMVGAPTYSNKGWHVGGFTNMTTWHSTHVPQEGTHLDPEIQQDIFSFRWILKRTR